MPQILTLTIQVKEDGSVEQVMGKVNKEVAGMEKQAAASTGGMESSFASWKTQTLIAVAAVTGALYTAKKVFDFGLEGARLNDLERNFESMARSAGISSSFLVQSLEATAAGTIDASDIMRVAIRGIQQDLSQTQMIGLMQLARLEAGRMGTSVGEAYERITTASTNMQTRMLKQYGILIDAGKANEEYARAIGKSAAALTEVEQVQAFVNATLKEGERLAKQGGEAVQNSAEEYERAAARIKDAWEGLKKSGAFLIASLVEGVTGKGTPDFYYEDDSQTRWMKEREAQREMALQLFKEQDELGEAAKLAEIKRQNELVTAKARASGQIMADEEIAFQKTGFMSDELLRQRIKNIELERDKAIGGIDAVKMGAEKAAQERLRIETDAAVKEKMLWEGQSKTYRSLMGLGNFDDQRQAIIAAFNWKAQYLQTDEERMKNYALRSLALWNNEAAALKNVGEQAIAAAGAKQSYFTTALGLMERYHAALALEAFFQGNNAEAAKQAQIALMAKSQADAAAAITVEQLNKELGDSDPAMRGFIDENKRLTEGLKTGESTAADIKNLWDKWGMSRDAIIKQVPQDLAGWTSEATIINSMLSPSVKALADEWYNAAYWKNQYNQGLVGGEPMTSSPGGGGGNSYVEFGYDSARDYFGSMGETSPAPAPDSGGGGGTQAVVRTGAKAAGSGGKQVIPFNGKILDFRGFARELEKEFVIIRKRK